MKRGIFTDTSSGDFGRRFWREQLTSKSHKRTARREERFEESKKQMHPRR